MSRSEMELTASGSDDVAISPTNSALSVVERVHLPAASESVWNVIKDFDNWQAWHPLVASTEFTAGRGNAVGAVRVLTIHDGARFTERLLSHDAASRSYQYSIVESPLPVVGYIARVEVQGDAHASTVVWSSTFRLAAGVSGAEVSKTIAGIYRAGLDRLAAVVK